MECFQDDILAPPDQFPFPYTPYKIQENFMFKLYSALENKNLGIFESPTGTGKSLSLICGSLQWLNDHEIRTEKQIVDTIYKIDIERREIENDSSDDWITSQSKLSELAHTKQKLQQKLELVKENRSLISNLKEEIALSNDRKENSRRFANTFSTVNSDEFSDDDMLLDEFENDLEVELPELEPEKDDEIYKATKIYFCSRTHSQLSQFIHEVCSSPFKDSIRLVPLASRRNYCINPDVKKLKNITLINERCLDLQKKSADKVTKKGTGDETIKRKKCANKCPYNNKEAITAFGKEILVNVCDLEELVVKGQQSNACPYYATRSALQLAQLVIVPYNTLLHKSTREANQIELKDNIVIIDEAHNLLDAIGNMYGAQLTGYQLCRCYNQLSQYKTRYEKRFSAFNLLYLNQLIFFIGKLIYAIGGKAGCNPVENSRKGVDTKIYTLVDFVHSIGIDNINIFKLINFCQRTKLTQKLQGFNEQSESVSTSNSTKVNNPKGGLRDFLKQISSSNKNINPKMIDSHVEDGIGTKQINLDCGNNPILAVVSFIESLSNHCEDGRIVCTQQITVGRGALKFLLLNPAAHFTDIVSEARSVIVAGGTMRPFSEFEEQLFKRAGADPSRIVKFSCSHVISPENILPVVLSSGPTGKQFDFSFQSRDSVIMLNELSRVLVNISNIIPAGIVCFFPSYEYEETVYQHFIKNGVIEKLNKKKKIFREPKKTNDIDTVLNEYSSVIKKTRHSETGSVNGALMFSVIGGKLSEGLNFSDDLGRAIVIVGLPYPNIKSPELQEKMKYLDNVVSPGSGKQHYENLCMKAVNQSIGRAVRHKLDYATVLLLDHRFARENVLTALPEWMKKSLQVFEKFGHGFAAISKFFNAKKKYTNEVQS